MNLKQTTNRLPWKLIAALGLFALIRPIIKIFGQVFDYEVAPAAMIAITAVIAITWISVVIRLKVKRPVLVLALSGVVYGITSIIMAVAIQAAIPDLRDEEAKIPVLLTAGLVGTTVFNFIYGAFLGLIAQALQKTFRF